MNYREAEAVTVSCFAERMENIRSTRTRWRVTLPW